MFALRVATPDARKHCAGEVFLLDRREDYLGGIMQLSMSSAGAPVSFWLLPCHAVMLSVDKMSERTVNLSKSSPSIQFSSL